MTSGSLPVSRAIDELREELSRSAPESGWPLSHRETLLLHGLLDGLAEPLTVVEISGRAGSAAGLFVRHERVARLVASGPAAGATREASVGRSSGAVELELAEPEAALTAAQAEAGDRDVLLVVHGLGERAEVGRVLGAAFAGGRPLVVLGDCRSPAGPFVEAAVADLIEAAEHGFVFRPLDDLAPGLGPSRLALLYAEASQQELDPVLERFERTFSRRFDVLRSLEREDEVVREASLELAQARSELERLQERLAGIESSTTWRLSRPLRATIAAARRPQR